MSNSEKKTIIEQKSSPKEKKNERKGKRPRKGKSLKRFSRWLTFLIFIGFAGFVTYVGWIQKEIPEGQGALVFTKLSYRDGRFTGGYDTKLTTSDGFHWRWERLFPTNMTIHLYPLSLRDVRITSTGILPSSDIYMDFIEKSGQDQFNWELSFDLTYHLKKESIPQLAQEKGIMPENLEAYLVEEENKIEGELFGLLSSFTLTQDNSREIEKLLLALNKSHPFLEITSLSPQTIVLPDLVLYNKARELYFSYLDARNISLEKMISREAPKMAVNVEKMKVLVEYGKVLTEYPVLIDFFALDENNDFGRMTPSSLMPEVLESE